MALLLGFVPLVVFTVLVRLSVSLALWLSFATAFTLGIRDFIETGRPRFLDAAFTASFGLMAIYDGFIEPGMSVAWIGLVPKLCLLSVSLWSLVRHEPFTLPYLQTQFSPEQLDTPLFAQSNYLLSWMWTGAFAIMAAADAATILLETVSPLILAAVGLATFVAALTFTWQYGVYISRRLAKASR